MKSMGRFLVFISVLALFMVLESTASAVYAPNNPPSIAGLPDQNVMVGQAIPILDLFQYASDPEDQVTALAFSIDSQSNTGVISCYINGNRYLACNPSQNAGFSDITVRVTDTEGLYDTDTFRITVQGQQPPANHAPAVNSVTITPSNPKDSDDLACTASVSDTDGNLERVQFRWFVDGGLEKTRTLYVSGSSASVSDTLGSTLSNVGDDVRCEATVFDAMGNSDTDSDTVTIGSPGCGVDVFNMQIVDNDEIRFSIKNTGSGSVNVNYKIYVDEAVIQNSQITLSSGETEVVHNTYNFGIGSFVVKAKAIANCGSTDSETVTHTALEDHHERPSIDYIRINPPDPEEFDDLTCRVEISDQSGDLDRVRFRWLVEGSLERTRTVYVNGYSDMAEDTLASGFSRGDDVECEATVYDREGDSDSSAQTVTIGEEENGECGVDIFNLRAIGNEIRFEVRNTGDDDQDVNYRIYVEDQVVRQNTIFLNSGERKTIQETFYFGSGDDYYVKVKVTSDCGSTDWESVYHQPGGACTARYLDEYKCEGLWRMRKYQNSDCSTLWINVESCPQGCYSGSCSPYPPYPPYGQCGVSIQRFDYQANVAGNQAASIWLEARNTGTVTESVTLSLFVDGQLTGSYPATVTPGATSLRLFYYYPVPGTHQVQVKAETNCGSTDTRTATITASGQVQPAPQPTPMQTSVSIYPSSADTSFCESKFITINVHSAKAQVFTIQVTGIPPEWVSYQSQNTLQAGEDRNLYIFAGPKELGLHQMKITVKAESENLVYSQDVSVYTAPCQQTAEPQGTGGITGMLEAVQSPWLWVVLIIVAAGIVIFLGTRRLKPDVEYYEPGYPVRAERRK
jgi:hypothetical protein